MTHNETPSSSGLARIGAAYRLIGVLLLNTLLLLVILEVGAQIILAVRPQKTLADEISEFKHKMLVLEYYAGQDWAAQYWDEHFQIVDNWSYSPYVLWQTRPFAGELLNVDEHGIRATPGSACQPDSYRIYTFGGSTMWGYGVYDGATLATYIQNGFAGQNVCVVNHGEVGYNSTQGVIKLLKLLQAGDIPDVVIFYDGTNEITTANRTGTAGAHFYMENIAPVVRGELVQKTGNPTAQSLRGLLSQTAIYRLIVGTPKPPEPNWALPPFDPAFVDGVTNTYLTNIGAANALADTYGFRFYAFVQPVLPVVSHTPNETEQRFLWDMPGGLSELFQVVYPRWETAAEERDYLTSLAHVLDDQTVNPMWIDFNHLTGLGNLVVGNTIVEVIRPGVEADLNSN